MLFKRLFPSKKVLLVLLVITLLLFLPALWTLKDFGVEELYSCNYQEKTFSLRTKELGNVVLFSFPSQTLTCEKQKNGFFCKTEDYSFLVKSQNTSLAFYVVIEESKIGQVICKQYGGTFDGKGCLIYLFTCQKL